jgi:hypothetical protein
MRPQTGLAKKNMIDDPAMMPPTWTSDSPTSRPSGASTANTMVWPMPTATSAANSR